MTLVPRLLCLVVLSFTAACGSVRDWQELKSSPMTLGECYDGVVYVATNSGFAADVPQCDRGNGVWQSRWRQRQLGLGRPGRYRLRAELMLEEGSAQAGWPVRYVIEQQKVKDLRKSMEPTESDWSNDAQDRESETIFGEKLSRRLSPKL